jgi:hypothetical protein
MVITNMKNTFGDGASDRDILRPFTLISDNLMNALPRQTEISRDPLQRLTGRTAAKNLRISLFIGSRARLERSPLPTGNLVESVYPVRGQLPVPLSLPDVPDPSAQPNLFAVENLHVECRHVRSPVARGVLDQSGHILDETFAVVHELYNSGREDKSRPGEQKVSLNI